MTSPISLQSLDDPLAAAVSADERLWDLRRGRPAGSLAERNAAVREAVRSGYTTAAVAQALGVSVRDIDRMLEP